MSQVIFSKVCTVKGHKIESIRKAVVFDPKREAYIDDVMVICVQCGRSHEEIMKEQRIRAPRKGKADPPAIDSIT